MSQQTAKPHQEEKSGLLNKLKKPFRSHSRSSSTSKAEDASTPSSPSSSSAAPASAGSYSHLPSSQRNLVESAYIEGQRKAERETGKKVPSYGFLAGGSKKSSRHGAPAGTTAGVAGGAESSSSSASSVSEDGVSRGNQNIIKKAYAAGRRQHHAEARSGTAGNVIAASSVGKLLSSPPPVHRKPVAKDPGGDFANEKRPTDVVKEEDLIAKGEGDQLDTIKGSNANTDTTATTRNNTTGVTENRQPAYSNDAAATQGTGIFFDPRDTQGGIYGKNADESHSEATRAELNRNRNLKTKPSAYQQQEEQQKHEQAIKDRAYHAGQKKGTKDAQAEEDRRYESQEAQGGDGPQEPEDVDPEEVHQQNRSAYNKKGVAAATEEARQLRSKYGGGDSGDGLEDSGAAGTGAGVAGAGATSGAGDSAYPSSKSSKNVGGNDTAGGVGHGTSKGHGVGSNHGSNAEYTSATGHNKGNLNTVAAAAGAGAAAGAAAIGVHSQKDKELSRTNAADSGAPGEGTTRGIGAAGTSGPSATKSPRSPQAGGFATNQTKPVNSVNEVSPQSFAGGQKINNIDPAIGQTSGTGNPYDQKSRSTGPAGAAGVAGVGAGAAGLGATGSNKPTVSGATGNTSGAPPFSDNKDLDRQLAELDRQINATDKELEQLHRKGTTAGTATGATTAGVGSSSSPSGHTGQTNKNLAVGDKSSGADTNASTAALYKEPIDTPKADQSESLGAKGANVGRGAGAGLAAGLAAAAAYAGLGGDTKESIIDSAYKEGVKKGSYKSGKDTGNVETNTAGATPDQFKSLDPAASDSTAKRSGGVYDSAAAFASGTLGLDSSSTFEDYEVINKSGKPSSGLAGDEEVARGEEDHLQDGSDKPGLLDGAAGAVTAAGAVAAGALGYDELKGSQDRSAAYKDKPELTDDSKYAKTASSAKESDTSSASHGGLLDSAKVAVASAGALAAGAFGYEGYHAATSDPEYVKSVIDDAYEAGSDKAKHEHSTTQEAYEAGKSKAHQERKDLSSKTDPSATSKQPGIDDEADSNKSGLFEGVLGSAAAAVGYGGYKSANANDANDDTLNPDAGEVAKAGTSKGPEFTDSEKDTVPRRDLAKENPNGDQPNKGGFLSSLGWNRSSPSSKSASLTDASKGDTSKTSGAEASSPADDPSASNEKSGVSDSTSSSNKGVLGTAGAALGAAAGAVGYNSAKGGSGYDKSLLDEAEEKYEDVRKAPEHRTTKTVDEPEQSGETGDGVQPVPGIALPKKDDDSENKGSTTSSAAKHTEASVAEYNKKHGIKKDDRNLIQIALDNDPELKKTEAHEGTPLGEDDEDKPAVKTGDVQDVPLHAYKNQNEFVATGGKQGDLGGKTKGAAKAATAGAGAAGAAGAAASGLKGNDDSSKSSVSSASSSSASSSAYSSKDSLKNTNTKDASTSGALGVAGTSGRENKDTKNVKDEAYAEGVKSGTYEAGNVAAAKDQSSKEATSKKPSHGVGAFGVPYSSKDEENKSLVTSSSSSSDDLDNATAHTHKRDRGLPASETGGAAEVEALEPEAVAANESQSSNAGKGAGVGLLGGLLGAVGYGATKDKTPSTTSDNAATGSHYRDGGLPASETGGAPEVEAAYPGAHQKDASVVDKSYRSGADQGAYDAGNEKGAHSQGAGSGVGGAAAGGLGGAALGSGSKSLSKSDHDKFYAAGVYRGAYEAGELKAAEDASISTQPQYGGAALGAGTGSHTASKGTNSRDAASEADGVVVEVIGIKDRSSASKVAEKASRDLAEQGVDLTSGKLVINAETKEVYKVETDGSNRVNASGDHWSDAGNKPSYGAVGGSKADSSIVDKSYKSGADKGAYDTGNEKGAYSKGIDSGAYDSGNTQGGPSAKSAGIATGAAGIATGAAGIHNSEPGSKTITSDYIPPRNELSGDSNPNKYHNEHEKAKQRLASAANAGTLGNTQSPLESKNTRATSNVGDSAYGSGPGTSVGDAGSRSGHDTNIPGTIGSNAAALGVGAAGGAALGGALGASGAHRDERDYHGVSGETTNIYDGEGRENSTGHHSAGGYYDQGQAAKPSNREYHGTSGETTNIYSQGQSEKPTSGSSNIYDQHASAKPSNREYHGTSGETTNLYAQDQGEKPSRGAFGGAAGAYQQPDHLNKGYHGESGETTDLYGGREGTAGGVSRNDLSPGVASGASLAKQEAQPAEGGNIPVTVQNSTNTKEAEAIAINTVEKLKANPEALAHTKSLKIDVASGKVFNEKGEQIHIPSEGSVGGNSNSSVASPDLGASTLGGGALGGAALGGAAYGGRKSDDVTKSPKYNYDNSNNLDSTVSDYGLDGTTPRSTEIPSIDVVGASGVEEERISKQVSDIIRDDPRILPTGTKKLIIDAQTGIVVDGFGREVQALSSNRSQSNITGAGEVADGQQDPSVQMPGSFIF